MLFPEGQSIEKVLPASTDQFEATTAEVVRLTKAGEEIHVLLTISPIRDSESDTLVGFAGISRSIQERYEAEQKIKHTADVLRKTNSDLKDFVYIASHDLQEPLRLITSYLNIINEDYGDKFDDDGRRYVNYVLDSSERLQQLINDLLSYSRLNTSEQPIALADTKDILKQVIADSRVLIEEKSGQIEASGELPIINCDQSQLRLVLSNLINNTLKYSQDDQAPKITVSASQNESETLFEVADNGIGFELKQAERIFQVFRRLHPRHKYSGTGIGLSICKKIVERHGGRIWAESEPGVGSKFFFTIPKQINPEIGELS
jgi:light-regulated signal transduction histidine kinase (bacteriophytochrome)